MFGLTTGEAITSAFAGIAAIGALLAWRTQVQNMRETFRPHMDIGGWSRWTEGKSDVISFKTLENCGRDLATKVQLNATQGAGDGRFLYVMGSLNVENLKSGAKVTVRNGDIRIFWDSVPLQVHSNNKFVHVIVKVAFFSPIAIRFDTEFVLHVQRPGSSCTLDNEVAQGVYLLHVTTKATPIWRIQMTSRWSAFKRRLGGKGKPRSPWT